MPRASPRAWAPDDRLYLPDPVYHGGTVERTRGSDWLAEQVNGRERSAEHIAERAKIGDALVAEAKAGDRIVVMGARDDTLIDFARELLDEARRLNGHGQTRNRNRLENRAR